MLTVEAVSQKLVSYRKDIDDGAVRKPEMLKDLAEKRNRVKKGCLVLCQDCFLSCKIISVSFGFGLLVKLTFEVSLNAAKDDVPQLDSAHLGLIDFSANLYSPSCQPSKILSY